VGMMRKVRATHLPVYSSRDLLRRMRCEACFALSAKISLPPDLVDRSAYELRCLERSAHAAWHMRLREYAERRVEALWSDRPSSRSRQYFPALLQSGPTRRW